MLNFVQPFIEAILTNLSECLPTWDIDILSAGEVFDPRNIPSTPAECYLYGRDKVSGQSQHFDCDVESTVSEWKEAVLTLQGKNNTREVLLFIVSHSLLYPYLAKISFALMIVPMHSADLKNERVCRDIYQEKAQEQDFGRNTST